MWHWQDMAGVGASKGVGAGLGFYRNPSPARLAQLKKFFLVLASHSQALHQTLRVVREFECTQFRERTWPLLEKEAPPTKDVCTLFARNLEAFLVRNRIRHYLYSIELFLAAVDWDRWMSSHKNGDEILRCFENKCTCRGSYGALQYAPDEEPAPVMGSLTKRELQNLRRARVNKPRTCTRRLRPSCPVVDHITAMLAFGRESRWLLDTEFDQMFLFDRETVVEMQRARIGRETRSAMAESLPAAKILPLRPFFGDSCAGSPYCVRSLDGARVRLIQPPYKCTAYLHRAVAAVADTLDVSAIRLEGGGVLSPAFWRDTKGTVRYSLEGGGVLVVCGEADPEGFVSCYPRGYSAIIMATTKELKLMWAEYVDEDEDEDLDRTGIQSAHCANVLKSRLLQSALCTHTDQDPEFVQITNDLLRDTKLKLRPGDVCAELKCETKRGWWLLGIVIDSDDTRCLEPEFKIFTESRDVTAFAAVDVGLYPNLLPCVSADYDSDFDDWYDDMYVVVKVIRGEDDAHEANRCPESPFPRRMPWSWSSSNLCRWDVQSLPLVWECLSPWTDPDLKMDLFCALMYLEDQEGFPAPWLQAYDRRKRRSFVESWCEGDASPFVDFRMKMWGLYVNSNWGSPDRPPFHHVDDERLISAEDPFDILYEGDIES